MAGNRFAIVTGGTGALGTVVTETLLKEGYQVAVPYTSDRNIEPFERQMGDLKARVTLVRTDLTVETEVQNFVQTTLDKFGQIDVLVNTVGGFVGGIPVAEMAEERWDFMMDLNLKSIFLCCKAVLPHMIERKYGKDCEHLCACRIKWDCWTGCLFRLQKRGADSHGINCGGGQRLGD